MGNKKYCDGRTTEMMNLIGSAGAAPEPTLYCVRYGTPIHELDRLRRGRSGARIVLCAGAAPEPALYCVRYGTPTHELDRLRRGRSGARTVLCATRQPNLRSLAILKPSA